MTAMVLPAKPWTNGMLTADERYYYDSTVGTEGAWRANPIPVGNVPAGTIVQWASNTIPANWLLADGSAVSRTVYPSLFAAIGTQYGTGDGTTTFNLPDLRGRVAVGKNGGSFGTLGATGGAETVTLTANNLPAHTHPITDPGHSHTQRRYDEGSSGPGYNRSMLYGNWQNKQFFDAESTAGAGTGITVNNNSTTNAAVNNLQPYAVLNYIIKATIGVTAGDSQLAVRTAVLEATNALSQNYVINGGFDIWQRGTSLNTGGFTYRADRYVVDQNVTSQRSTDVPSGVGVGYSMQISAGTGSATIRQAVELPGTSVAGEFSDGAIWTISFYAKSATARALSVGAVFRPGIVGAGVKTVLSDIVVGTTSTSWTRYSNTFTIPSGSISGANCFAFVISAAAGTSSDVYFTGVQLEQGSTATAFRRNANSLQGELAACQRYFQLGAAGASGRFNSSTAGELGYKFAVPMRAAPSVAHLANYTAYRVGIAPVTVTATGVNGINSQGCCLTITTSNVAAGDFAIIPGYPEAVAFSAEL